MTQEDPISDPSPFIPPFCTRYLTTLDFNIPVTAWPVLCLHLCTSRLGKKPVFPFWLETVTYAVIILCLLAFCSQANEPICHTDVWFFTNVSCVWKFMSTNRCITQCLCDGGSQLNKQALSLGKNWVFQAPSFDPGNLTVLCSVPSCVTSSIIHAVHGKKGSERKREGGREEGEEDTWERNRDREKRGRGSKSGYREGRGIVFTTVPSSGLPSRPSTLLFLPATVTPETDSTHMHHTHLRTHPRTLICMHVCLHRLQI